MSTETTDGWLVTQHDLDPGRQRVWESLCSLGNGYFGGRGTHEERYSGDTMQGNYLAGIYYPDPTRVGWWKNGYPDYFAKVVNAADWTPIHVAVDGEQLDLARHVPDAFERTLNLRTGTLHRSFRVAIGDTVLAVDTERFVSMAAEHLAAIRYSIDVLQAPDDGAELVVTTRIDGDVVNEDSNHGERFWEPVAAEIDEWHGIVATVTKKTRFVAATGMNVSVLVDDEPPSAPPTLRRDAMSVARSDVTSIRAGTSVTVLKLVANITSRTEPATRHDATELLAATRVQLDVAEDTGFDELRAEHATAWERIWDDADVVVEGDPDVQQGLRFSIFQLNSTFRGDDPDLNIGPKGFTGEKYGGVTYWDTEAFCLPFYLATTGHDVSRNLLRYRYRQLDKAIQNATKLGFDGGAALFPMVTITGEECHNEWEITFEEIHRNGAIAFAVFDYLRSTGDDRYLLEGGLEVLVAISRFWVQRVSWSTPREAWVMLGVTGPNEYENNVDNNWYTSLMAQWTLRYTIEALELARSLDRRRVDEILERIEFDEPAEIARWTDVADRIHLPEDLERGVFLQQTNYLDKELLTVDDLDPAERPLNHHWSWDRILRSCFIKQADVLQGLWVLGERYDDATVERNFDFYEPRTVHESSLSPSVHAILAARLGRLDKAHQMLRRSARLDLDDVNHDTADGCHTTSMAGTWLAAVQGFGGMRIVDGALSFRPQLAPGWDRLAFSIQFRGTRLRVESTSAGTTITRRSGPELTVRIESTSAGAGPLDTRI